MAVLPVEINVHVRLATELWDGAGCESQSAVRLELLTTYEALGRFSRELRSCRDDGLTNPELHRTDYVKSHFSGSANGRFVPSLSRTKPSTSISENIPNPRRRKAWTTTMCRPSLIKA